MSSLVAMQCIARGQIDAGARMHDRDGGRCLRRQVLFALQAPSVVPILLPRLASRLAVKRSTPGIGGCAGVGERALGVPEAWRTVAHCPNAKPWRVFGLPRSVDNVRLQDHGRIPAWVAGRHWGAP